MRKMIVAFVLLLLTVLPATAVDIVMNDDAILVDGQPISETADDIWLQRIIETHPGVSPECRNVENRVITITEKGEYTLSGTLTDGQIRVDAGKKDTVRLILNGVELSCRTAPAILIIKTKDTKTPGEAGAIITLADGSENHIHGAFTEKDPADPDSKKYHAAISSRKSLLIDGTGKLVLDSEMEGITSNLHLTINGGKITIHSGEDPLNAREDGVSMIRINGGNLYFLADGGRSGDGLDSNGDVEINGGFVVALANPRSIDTGLDATGKVTINGGTVISAARDMPSNVYSDTQPVLPLQFLNGVENLLIAVPGEAPLIKFTFPHRYISLVISSPDLTGKDYEIFADGEKAEW